MKRGIIPKVGEKMKKEVIIDADIGTDVDDLFALLFSLKRWDIKIRGIITAGGNTLLRARIVGRILKVMRKKIPICAGENISLEGKSFWQSGLEKNYLKGEKASVKEHIFTNVASFFKLVCKEKPLILLAWAPLTNVAKILQLVPPPQLKIRKIIWMGGSLCGVKEHNLKSDIKAAEIVFNSSIPIRIIPREITHQFFITRNELQESIKKKTSSLFLFLFERFEEWLKFVERNRERYSFDSPPDAAFMHDFLTVASLVEPKLFKFQKMRVRIVGKKIVEACNGREIEVCVGLKNKEEIKELLLNTLFR
jgi:inosine-uridine nucleoside N-ribohydrolase